MKQISVKIKIEGWMMYDFAEYHPGVDVEDELRDSALSSAVSGADDGVCRVAIKDKVVAMLRVGRRMRNGVQVMMDVVFVSGNK